jgi:photosystem II stability/assembly factor-like uncharacterized protein
MRQPRKLLRGRIGILVLGALAVALVLATVPFVLAKAFSISPTLTEGITLREAYDLAANAARAWQNDAVLYSLNSIEDEEPFMAAAAAKGMVLGDRGRRASWNVDFFSPGTGKHYNVLLRDGKIFRTRPFDNPPPESFLDVTNLAFDSPAALRIAQDHELKPGSGRWALAGYHFSLATTTEGDVILGVRGTDAEGRPAAVGVNASTGELLDRRHRVIKDGGVFRQLGANQPWIRLRDPALEGGIDVLALPPDFAKNPRIYASTTGGVIWSDDAGDTWPVSTLGLPPVESVTALVLSPAFAQDQTLFAGTDGGRLFKSTDGGRVWQSVRGGFESDGWPIYAIALSPTYVQDQTLYVGTYGNGLWRSTDGGHTWTAANSGLTNQRIRSLTYIRQEDAMPVLYTGTDKGLFTLTDGAKNWQRLEIDGIADPHVNTIVAVPAETESPTIYVGLATEGIYKSTDNGNTWVSLAKSPQAVGGTVMALAVSPQDPQKLYKGARRTGFAISDDGGENWLATPLGVESPQYFQNVLAIVALPGAQEIVIVALQPQWVWEPY